MANILDVFFPKSCTICSKHGEYLCSKCKKLFKRNLPECYICRKLSTNYQTHDLCKRENSLDSVVVLWKYEEITSKILKKYKYGLVYDLESTFEEFVKEGLSEVRGIKREEKSLVVPTPISLMRLRDRGFNQSDVFAKAVSEYTGIDYNNTLLKRVDSDSTHQSLLDKEERILHSTNFEVQDKKLLDTLSEIIIVDDVITTGKTLEDICKCIREVNKDVKVRAICLFRGRPYYIK